MENLIGRKIKGFKFEDEIIGYDSYMNKHIGSIGYIVDVSDNEVEVQFESVSWFYPLDQIEQHLVEEEPKGIFEKSKEALRKYILENKEQVKEDLQRLRELSEPEETIEEKITRLEKELEEAKKESKEKVWILVWKNGKGVLDLEIKLENPKTQILYSDGDYTLIDIIDREY